MADASDTATDTTAGASAASSAQANATTPTTMASAAGAAAADGDWDALGAPYVQRDAATGALLRHVLPVVSRYETHVKRRWLGQAVADLYTSQFGSFPRAYFVRQSDSH